MDCLFIDGDHGEAGVEAEAMFTYITCFEGSSVDPAIVDQDKAQVLPSDSHASPLQQAEVQDCPS